MLDPNDATTEYVSETFVGLVLSKQTLSHKEFDSTQ